MSSRTPVKLQASDPKEVDGYLERIVKFVPVEGLAAIPLAAATSIDNRLLVLWIVTLLVRVRSHLRPIRQGHITRVVLDLHADRLLRVVGRSVGWFSRSLRKHGRRVSSLVSRRCVLCSTCV